MVVCVIALEMNGHANIIDILYGGIRSLHRNCGDTFFAFTGNTAHFSLPSISNSYHSSQWAIKSRLKLRNACSHSVQNLLSSRSLSKNLKIKTYTTIILPVVWYGCETWSLKLREGSRRRVFENRVLRRIFGPKRDRGVEKTT